MIRWLAIIAVVLSLGGCGGVDAFVYRLNADRFQKACVGFGFTPQTTAFANCMVQQSAQNEAANQSMQDRAALDAAADKLKRDK